MVESHCVSWAAGCRGATCSVDADSTAATVSSRFSRASSGSAYLSLITSPCSVNLISPARTPHGWARIESYVGPPPRPTVPPDRKSTRLNSSHVRNSYAVFCLKKKKKTSHRHAPKEKKNKKQETIK